MSIYGDIRFRDFGSALVCLQGEDGKKIRDKSTDHAFIIRDRSERPDKYKDKRLGMAVVSNVSAVYGAQTW